MAHVHVAHETRKLAMAGVLFGLLRSLARWWQTEAARVLPERYVVPDPRKVYAELGFRPPADGHARLT